MITQTELKNLLHYDSGSGLFYWLRKDSCKIAGRTKKNGRVEIRVNKKLYAAHRLAWLYVYGEFPEHVVDHIDGNPNNNSIQNLRSVTRSQNLYNSKIPITNTSGVKGVHWSSRENKWRVKLHVNGKEKNFGYFDSLEVAKLIITEARDKFHGEYCRHY